MVVAASFCGEAGRLVKYINEEKHLKILKDNLTLKSKV